MASELKAHKKTPCEPLSAEEYDSMMQNKANSMKKEVNGSSMRKKTEKGPFVCEKCGRMCANKSNLNAHRAMHNDNKPYECWLCHKAIRLKRNLLVHIKIHTISSKIRK